MPASKRRSFPTGRFCFTRCSKSSPTAVLLDWMMPGQDGLAVLRAMRENSVTRPIPIIMMTARPTRWIGCLGWSWEADDYVTKPFSVKELAAGAAGRHPAAGIPGRAGQPDADRLRYLHRRVPPPCS